ncbi:MAG: DUF917 domain-containing protein [Treponema sp.]|jgi:DUF917 family protein|nr:DUF917 domain-containing protein [Treponema sp.]
MKLLYEDDVEKIALGAAVLGSGGGGDPHLGKLMAIQAIKEHGPVRLITADELAADDLVFPSAAMGAPVVMLEKIPNGSEPKRAIQALESYLGKKATAIISIEAGGINSCIPIYTAACLGLPLVDGDGMGRAFPELTMMSFGIGGLPASPMVVCDEKGNLVIINAINNQWAETLARAVTVASGLFTQIGIYVMSGDDVKHFAIKNTISLAAKIGAYLIHESGNPVNGLINLVGGYILFEGKITAVRRDLTTGFIRGTVRLEGLDSYEEHVLSIDFQNENLIARLDDNPIAMVPDLITVLDRERGVPILTEGLKYGQRTVVIGIPCDPFWRTEGALKYVNPHYFKYDLEYTAIEEIMKGIS